MKLFQKKQCLVEPEGALPAKWPSGWEFPPDQAWPPGWPLYFFGDAHLLAEFASGILQVRVLDCLGEDSDIINGNMLKVIPSNGRVKIPGSPWSLAVMFPAAAIGSDGFGFRHALEFEAAPESIRVEMFGHIPTLYTNVKVN